jgi:hypothetical protein
MDCRSRFLEPAGKTTPARDVFTGDDRMNRKIIVVLLFAGTLLLLSGCSAITAGTSQTSTKSEKSTFTAKTEVKETELVLKPGMVFHTLSIRRMKLTAGKITLTLTGPDGKVVWEQSFLDTADFRRDLTFDSLPGKWILRIELSEASGSYDLVWRAGNTP